MSDLTDLPHDLFLLVISYLSPSECVLCRRVSRSWNIAFTSHETSWSLMTQHFPRVQEMRTAVGALDHLTYAHMFSKVAQRYAHLRSARPRLIEKIDLLSEADEENMFREVEPWNRQLQWRDNDAIFQHGDPSWCLDDGLLIYRERESGRYVAYDLETNRQFPVPFEGVDKIVRRIRLVHGTLVIEWCERKPHLQWDGRRDLHWHFGTAFDVHRPTEPDPAGGAVDSLAWEIRFRCEWVIDSFSLAVNSQDRFFSAHTATHYTVYIWLYNGSLGDQRSPIEELLVWEIKDASPYRPSADPKGEKAPDITQPQPRIIQTFKGYDLDFLGVRQGPRPLLREILIDEANVYVHEEDNRWLVGPHASIPQPREHPVRSVGIPFSGVGPRWVDECCTDTNVALTFCDRFKRATRLGSSSSESGGFGGTWPGWAPCWRHESFPYTTACNVADTAAGVRFVARRWFKTKAISLYVLPRTEARPCRTESDNLGKADFASDLWEQLMGRGKIVGDERWIVGEDEHQRITIARF
ncbi:hypothetical protein GGR51DRAFT_512035 [Nemania sp. FL0031]|nr:hypothetical protein GGR51DRAFT_512035 [Nemania sp. FL0031]